MNASGYLLYHVQVYYEVASRKVTLNTRGNKKFGDPYSKLNCYFKVYFYNSDGLILFFFQNLKQLD